MFIFGEKVEDHVVNRVIEIHTGRKLAIEKDREQQEE